MSKISSRWLHFLDVFFWLNLKFCLPGLCIALCCDKSDGWYKCRKTIVEKKSQNS